MIVGVGQLCCWAVRKLYYFKRLRTLALILACCLGRAMERICQGITDWLEFAANLR